MSEATAHDRLMEGVAEWMEALNAYPGWREWNRKKLGKTISFGDDDVPDIYSDMGDFTFTDEIERQHAVVLGYLNIASTVHSTKDIEFYFRRYPFRGLPVSKHDHISNVCEMYFSRVYQFRERAKNLLNAVNKLAEQRRVDVSLFLKTFDNVFDAEIRERNAIHHRQSFSDIQIDRISLTFTMAESADSSMGWAEAHDASYRAATREWAARVKRRAAILDKFKDATAKAILDCCPILQPKRNRT